MMNQTESGETKQNLENHTESGESNIIGRSRQNLGNQKKSRESDKFFPLTLYVLQRF